MAGTWSYSGDPSTNRKDAVRFLIGDTDPDDQLVSDEEILYMIEKKSNDDLAAADLAMAIAANYSRLTDKSVGDLSLSYSQKAEQYRALAHELKTEAGKTVKPLVYAGGISKADKTNRELDDDRVRPSFTRRQMDIPSGGVYAFRSIWTKRK